jgi:dsDNA-specific endonuclease/ATPase MutS2
MLDSAISNNYYKVVFIHGIGNGTLKSAIISAISEYDNVEFRTAPFAKYGNGAVEIIIHRNS